MAGNEHDEDETLETVGDYMSAVRILLQDRVHPHRYKEEQIIRGLNMALLEARRLRADLFVTRYGNHVPRFEKGDGGQYVDIEPQFRLGLVYGITAQVLEQDQEDVNDTRATSMNGAFHAILTGTAPAPIQGGTPGPQSAQR
jgi:hypothetical protein